MSTVTLEQNIPTPLWGAHVVATNVMEGERADLRITPAGGTLSVHKVVVGDHVDVAGTTATVEAIEGGGHDGPPGRSSGRVTLSRPDEEA